MNRRRLSNEEKDAHREGLTDLTQQYAKMVAKFNGKDGMVWDEGIVEAILEHPADWPKVIARMWTMFKQWQKDNEKEVQQS